ncbi:hypothetical protein HaLaN_31842 [Haematococcus lacustris]|uniref:Uncharacterized protein n=1 Tax=Haematococcus lacustris TaxID=44745 RepID=A0A6A0AL80_HAELA|nr:hypothetical protein HaLaN_31842 [Haematococcus lacustris]
MACEVTCHGLQVDAIVPGQLKQHQLSMRCMLVKTAAINRIRQQRWGSALAVIGTHPAVVAGPELAAAGHPAAALDPGRFKFACDLLWSPRPLAMPIRDRPDARTTR